MSEQIVEQKRPDVVVTPPSDWDTSSVRGLIEIVREDLSTNGSGLLVPSTHMLIVHRWGEWSAERREPFRRLGLLIFKLLNVYIRNVLGFEIDRTVKIGRRVTFVHQNGVVIQPETEIGDGCMLYHNVTIGRRWDDFRPDAFRHPV